MERYAVCLAFSCYDAGLRLAKIFAVRPVANNRRNTVGGQPGDIGRMELGTNSTSFAELVDSHSVRPCREES